MNKHHIDSSTIVVDVCSPRLRSTSKCYACYLYFPSECKFLSISETAEKASQFLLKPIFFEGNRTLIQWWPTAKAALCWLKWFSIKTSTLRWSTEIQTFISTGHHAKVLLYLRQGAWKVLQCNYEECIFPACRYFWDCKTFFFWLFQNGLESVNT